MKSYKVTLVLLRFSFAMHLPSSQLHKVILIKLFLSYENKTGANSFSAEQDWNKFWQRFVVEHFPPSQFAAFTPRHPRPARLRGRRRRRPGCRTSTGSGCPWATAWWGSSPCSCPRSGCQARQSRRRKPGRTATITGAHSTFQAYKLTNWSRFELLLISNISISVRGTKMMKGSMKGSIYFLTTVEQDLDDKQAGKMDEDERVIVELKLADRSSAQVDNYFICYFKATEIPVENTAKALSCLMRLWNQTAPTTER